VNGAMRLAGDFDLWRRFAQHADLVMTDALLGVFRVREGQLSASIERYHKEIDDVLSAEEKARRREMAEAFRAATTPEAVREAGFACRAAVNVIFAGGWHLVEQLLDSQVLKDQLAAQAEQMAAQAEQLAAQAEQLADLGMRFYAARDELSAFKRSRWTKLGSLLRLTKLRAHLQADTPSDRNTRSVAERK
jgi:hypothetical protein